MGGARAVGNLRRAATSSVAAAVDLAIEDALEEHERNSERGRLSGVTRPEPPVLVIAGSVYLLAEARAALFRRSLEARPTSDQYDRAVAEQLLGEIEPDEVVK